MDIRKLRSMILRPCENVFRVPYSTKNYSDVLHWWKFYKNGHMPKKLNLLNDIFNFRDLSDNHIIMYSSSAIDDKVLILGKVNGEYININIPLNIGIKESFVAVYV